MPEEKESSFFNLFKDSNTAEGLFEVDDIDPAEANSNDGEYVNAMNQNISAWGNQNIDAYTVSAGGSKNVRVMGLPLIYSPLDDPDQRVFGNTFESDLPLVFITPGKPKVNRKLFSSVGAGSLFQTSSVVATVGNAIVEGAFSMIGIKTNKDSRFISFKPAYSEYYKYVQTILQYIHASMGLDGVFDFGRYDSDDNFKNFGLAFYASNSSSIDEGANNEYIQSDIGQEANAKQAEIRENKMLAGMGMSGLLDSVVAGLRDMVVNATENIPVIGSLVGSFIEGLDGSQLQYPDVWGNSTFDRSYSLEFKFYSPYGDPQSIMNYVYIPFISLICMGLPLQDSYYSYKQPFLVRLSSPGRFECDCGVIRNISIVRGEEQTWTAEGLPRSITVRLSVADLYPSLVITKKNQQLKYNTGLTSYIECMAGIRYDQLNFIKRLSMKFNIGKSRTYQILTLADLDNKFYDKLYSVTQTTLNFLR